MDLLALVLTYRSSLGSTKRFHGQIFFKHCFLHYASIVRENKKKCVLLMHLYGSEKPGHAL